MTELSPFLAHLSQRLIGELIEYSWSGVRQSSVRSQCSKIFFSETAGPIKAKFYVEPPWAGGMIFYLRHLGHMTKMAATPIYESLSKFLSVAYLMKTADVIINFFSSHDTTDHTC